MPRPDSRRLLRTDAGYDPSHRHPDDPDYSPEQGLCSYKFQYYDTCAGQHGLDSCNEADLHAVHAALDLNLDAVSRPSDPAAFFIHFSQRAHGF